MRFLVVLFLAVLLFPFYSSVSAQNVNRYLFGKWESIDLMNRNGIQLDFERNNKLVFIQLLVADYKYKLKNNMLIDYIKEPYPRKGMIIDTSYMKIKKDTIFRWYNRQGWKDTVVMIRDKHYKIKGNKKNNPLLGKWNWLYPTKDTATGFFNSNGTWRFYLKRNFIDGSYLVKDDTLEISFNKDKNKKKQIKIFKVKDNGLEITDIKSGLKIFYKRVNSSGFSY